MWDELKGLGGLLFFVGCIITWVAFLAPRINPTWISDPYQLWQWGVLVLGVGIGIFVLAWMLGAISGVRFRRRRTYYDFVRGRRVDRRTKRIAMFIIGGLVLTIIAWGLITYGPEVARWVGEHVGSGVLPPSEIRAHPSKYIGKEVAVEGYFFWMSLPSYTENFELTYVTSGVIAEKYPAESMYEVLAVIVSENVNVISGEKYRFAGVLEQWELSQFDVSGLFSVVLHATEANPV